MTLLDSVSGRDDSPDIVEARTGRLEASAPATSPRLSAADCVRAPKIARREPGRGSGAATAGAEIGVGVATEADAGRGAMPAAGLTTGVGMPPITGRTPLEESGARAVEGGAWRD